MRDINYKFFDSIKAEIKANIEREKMEEEEKRWEEQREQYDSYTWLSLDIPKKYISMYKGGNVLFSMPSGTYDGFEFWYTKKLIRDSGEYVSIRIAEQFEVRLSKYKRRKRTEEKMLCGKEFISIWKNLDKFQDNTILDVDNPVLEGEAKIDDSLRR